MSSAEVATLKSPVVRPDSPQHVALRDLAEELSALAGAASLLHWDERTKLPANGGPWRARQSEAISAFLHERALAPDVEEAISALEDVAPDDPEARVARRDFDMATKLPMKHVRAWSSTRALTEMAWAKARQADDFASFAPQLQSLLDLARERAELLGYETERYDALHDLFEEGSRAAVLEPMFEGLREPLNALIDVQPTPDVSLLKREYPIEAQERIGHEISALMGFDLESGRIDATTHPFCVTVGVGDVRLTTRYDERWLPGSLFSTIHEAGHGIYEQAFHRLELPATISNAPGLGMHESQSRMYENIVGRSHDFWTHAYPLMQEAFPTALGSASLDEFVAAINAGERSLIRVEADELTYNLHIAARFELERAMINGDLDAKDLPEAWNDAYRRWVGIEPTCNRDGCLQDVHWSAGLFGYFPTYTLGNVYSAQFVEQARVDIPDLDARFAAGDVITLRSWFDEHVYQHGAAFTGAQFVERITGGGVDSAPLVRYLQGRFGG